MEDGLKDSALRRLSETLEHQLRNDRVEEGDDWYLVSLVWWTRVLGASSSDDTDNDTDDSDDAGPRGKSDLQVENAVLLELELSSQMRKITVLKPMLVEGQDYRLVSQRVWNQLSDHFGFDWEIARPVVTRERATTRIVEVYPVAFEVLGWSTGLNEPIELLDAEQKPLIVTASETCLLKELQVKIWNSATTLKLPPTFPDIYAENIGKMVQVCYRVDGTAPWKPLQSAVRKETRPLSCFQTVQDVEMLADNVRVQDLQLEPRDYKPGKEKLHHLLVEGRFLAPTDEKDWRHSKFYSEIQAVAWRFTLERGQLIDAMDTDKKWYESRILDMNESHVKVHYRGWTAKWDEWLSRTSPRLAPLHTMVRNWRDFKVEDQILVGREVERKHYPEWRIARVVNVEKQLNESLRIEVEVDGIKTWMDAQDEMLCPVGTHKAVNESSRSTSAVTFSPSVSSYSGYRREEAGRGRPEVAGVVGLSNLGNTCFMNSMLQCLINTAPLRDYFLKKDPTTGHPFFTKEINRDNPLGMGGMMAVKFASLLRKMWSNEYHVVTPTELKSVIGQYAPQFAGYQQQDSQELMNFLLDGLHEDLNRVRTKPYTTPVERNDRTDSEVAREEWQQFLRRNDSIIVDNFMGQLRSHVTCSNPECGNESITFDPYMSLSVPIPSKETISVEVQLFWANGDIPMKYALRLPKEGCNLFDAKEKLSELSGLPVVRIFFVEVWNQRVVRAYADKMSIERLGDHVLHAYELELPVTEYLFSSPSIRPYTGPRRLGTLESDDESKKHLYLVELQHQAPMTSPVDGRAMDGSHDLSGDENGGLKHRRVEVELVNLPLLVSIDRKGTMAEVHDKVWRVVHRLVATKARDEVENRSGCGKDPQASYRLYLTEVDSGSTNISDLVCDRESLKLSTKRPFHLTLEWNRHGYQRGYDERSAKRVELHESMNSLKISTKMESLTLFDCLTKFTEREQLGEADTWFCPKCKTHVRAFKKFDLFSLPKVLIFHLKRFRYAQNSFYMHRDKISTLVDFPVEGLDLADFVIGPRSDAEPLYDLYAVSEHMGGLGGGHYTAVAKNPVTKQWFEFNDSHTSPKPPDAAVSSNAYVLFYIRRE